MSEQNEPASSTPSSTPTPATTPTPNTTPTNDPSLISSPPGKDEGTSATTEAAKAEDGAKGDGKDSNGGEPLTVADLKLPEGVTFQEGKIDSFLALINDQKISRADLAQKLVDMQVALQSEGAEAGSKAWNDLQETWKQEAKAMPEFGGDKLTPTLNHISRLIESYGGDTKAQEGLRHVFDLTGAGNHPQVIAFLGRIAKDLVKEGTPQTGSPPSAREGASLAQRMFPDLKSTG